MCRCMISLRFSVKGYISLLCGGLVRYITGMGVVGCYAVYMDKVIRHKPNPWWHHLVCRWLLTLTFLVGACGEFDPMFVPVGSACESIVQGRDVTLGPTYSTVYVGGCSGTYIASSVVLTAAHCGDVGEVEAGGVTRASVLYVPHPDYDRATLTNDLALIFLDGELPIDIASLGVPTYGAALIQGYGKNEYSESGILREGNVFIDAFWAPDSIVIETPNGEPDTCYGDSGGPLYQAGALVGVTRSGLPLDSAPDDPMEYCGQGGLYTVVANFANWLNSEVEHLNWVGSC